MAEPTIASIFSQYAQAASARRRVAKEELHDSQRGRLLQAVVASVARKGYASTTVADVVSGAAISRNAFYEHFADKEECFLAALATGGELLASEILAVPLDPDDLQASTRRRVATLLNALDATPAFARALLLEAPAAGRRAHTVVGELRTRVAHVLHEEQILAADHDPRLPRVPQRLYEAAVGGILELIRIELLRDGDAARTAALEDDIVLLLRAIDESPPELFAP
jgi:AcrR family transcriptional regulator